MKSDYLSYHHYVCELLEPLFYVCAEFTCKIQQPIRKCAIRVYCSVIRIGEGGGVGVDQKVCGRWVSPTLQSKLEYTWMKLEYLTYITMYVNS